MFFRKVLLTYDPLIRRSWIWKDDSHVSVLFVQGLATSPYTPANIQTYSASAVNHVLAYKGGIDEIVVFFFPQFDDPQSLCAETVIRSIIRQSLDPVTLSEEMEADLVEMDQKSSTGLVELAVLLRKKVAQSKMFYIFIDALDEFEARERRALLDLLVSLGSGGSSLRVFLAGRESLVGELKGKLTGIEHVSMASAQAKPDIFLYIEEALQERIKARELVVGNHSLILDIKQALVKHADGMYVDSTPSLNLLLTAKVSLGHFPDRRALCPALRRRHTARNRMPSKNPH